MNKSILSVAALAVTASATAVLADAKGNGGLWLTSNVNISPFGEISYGHDSNPHSARDYTKEAVREKRLEDPEYKGKIEESDELVYKAGLDLIIPGNAWKLDGRAFYLWDNYTSDNIDDEEHWAETLRLSGSTDGGTKWSLSEMIQKVEYDDEIEITQCNRRQTVLNGTVDAAVSDKSSLLLGAFYTDNHYDDDDDVVDEALDGRQLRVAYDYSSYGGSVGFASRLTDKTDWLIRSTYTQFDKENYDSDAHGIDTQIGIRSRTSEKLSFSITAGAEYYKDFEYNVYDENFDVIEHTDAEDEVGFTYNVSVEWKITDRLSLTVAGYADYQPAEDVNDNSLYANTIGATFAYRPGENWSFRFGGAYRREDYTRDIVEREDAKGNPYSSVGDEVVDGNNRTDDQVSVFANASYAFTKYSSIFADWHYTDVSSSIDGWDYDRQRYAVGLALKY